MKLTISDPTQIFTLADKLAKGHLEQLKKMLDETYRTWLVVAANEIVKKLSKDAIDFSEDDRNKLFVVIKQEVLPSHASDMFKGLNVGIKFK